MAEDQDIEEELEETKKELQGMIQGIQGETEPDTDKETRKDTLEENKQGSDNSAQDTLSNIEKYRNKKGKFVDPDTGEKFDTKKGFQLYLKNIK